MPVASPRQLSMPPGFLAYRHCSPATLGAPSRRRPPPPPPPPQPLSPRRRCIATRRPPGRDLIHHLDDGLANAFEAPPGDVNHLHLTLVLDTLRGCAHGLIDHLKSIRRRESSVVDE